MVGALVVLGVALLASLGTNIALMFLLVKHIRGESERLTNLAQTAMRASKATSATDAATAEIQLQQAAIGLKELQRELEEQPPEKQKADLVTAANGKTYNFADLEPLTVEEYIDAKRVEKMYE